MAKAKHMNFGEVTRAEKEQRFWMITSIVSLVIGLGILVSFLFFVDAPFEKRYPADHYYMMYLAISFISVTILGFTKYFRLDERDRRWYHPIISVIEVNMWLAIMTIIIVVSSIVLLLLIDVVR